MKTVLILPVFILLACGSGDGQADQEGTGRLHLQEVQRYGDLEVSGSVPPAIREAGGGTIGSETGVLADDSSVYVLDQQTRKIIVFDTSGEVRRVILGGPGDGPREFRTPVHLTWSGQALSVLDYGHGRISRFSKWGEYLGSSSMGRSGLRHMVRGDSIWITRSRGLDDHVGVVTIFNSDGDSIGAGPIVEPVDKAFGSPILMGTGPDGTVLVSTDNPGVWYQYDSTGWSRRGDPIFPDLEPPVREQIGSNQWRISPAQASVAGIGVLGDGRVLIRYWRYTRPFDWEDPPTQDEVEHFIAVFSQEGALQETSPFDGSGSPSTKYTYVDWRRDRLYVSDWEPYPQIVEYQIVEED